MAAVMSFMRSYIFELLTLIGAIVMGGGQPKRKNGRLFFAAGVVADICLVFCWSACSRHYPAVSLFSTVRYLGQFILVMVIVYIWLDCKALTAMFIATTSYCMQQLSNRINRVLYEILIPGQRGTFVDMALLASCIIIVYGVTWHFFNKRERESDNLIQIANPVQLVIMTLALTVMIFIEQLSLPMIRSVASSTVRIANYLSSAVFALLSLILEFNVLKKRDLERELAITRKLLEEEQKHYEKEKKVVEAINIKCHDLKHQLQTIGGEIPVGERAQIQQAVDQYDMTVRTGNYALDVVLTMKRMICENSNIEFSCILDSKALGFMGESDIYSLFGNMLDNAIEEVRGFDDAHRVISLTIHREKRFALIHEENYVQKHLRIVDGIPQTTKADAASHGFGIRSMQMIAEKYNGHLLLKIDDGVFQLDIMLPIPKANSAAESM